VVLIDRGKYEHDNLMTQDIVPADVNKPKAEVQARRLRRNNPRLYVEAIVDDAKNVPLGKFKGDVILGGLDSKRARQIVTQKAWQLGVPYVDAGVNGEGMLARVSVYYPGRENPCYECSFFPEDYETAEQDYPCFGNKNGEREADPPATGASSSLGALSASLLAIQCQKMLGGSHSSDRSGHELVLDASGAQLYSTRLVYNSGCQMPEHHNDPIETTEVCSGTTTIGQLVAPAVDGTRLRVVGQEFVIQLTCSKCGDRRSFLRLKASLRPAHRHRCRRCAGDLVVTGFGSAGHIDVCTLSPRALDRTLHSIGLREGDVLQMETAGGGGRFVEVNSDANSSTAQHADTRPRQSKVAPARRHA